MERLIIILWHVVLLFVKLAFLTDARQYFIHSIYAFKNLVFLLLQLLHLPLPAIFSLAHFIF